MLLCFSKESARREAPLSNPFTPRTDDLYDLYDLYDLFPLHDVDLPGKANTFLICIIEPMLPGGSRIICMIYDIVPGFDLYYFVCRSCTTSRNGA